MAAAAAWVAPATGLSYQSNQPALQLVANCPYLLNGVVVMDSGRRFIGLPRWPGFEQTPALVELLPDGVLRPYPGGVWNQWNHQADPRTSLIAVNAINSFDGKTLWVVDQGSDPSLPSVAAGAQKVLQIDTVSNRVIRQLTFPESVLPKGANLNDIRIHGHHAFFTESGLGSIVITDLNTGSSVRRLYRSASTKAQPDRPKLGPAGRHLVLPDGHEQITHADPIELSPDGQWLYFQPASGPLYRVEVAALLNPAIDETGLERHVEYVYDTPTLGGTAMDDLGNIYLAESERPRISVLRPDGSLKTLIEDDRLLGADALFITPQRELFIPLSQVPNLQFLQGPGGPDRTTRPFKIWKLQLPAGYGGPIRS